jgi:hypothetical protein|tara:strand:+ start:303 stop:737 length:435 start_codon:yes stop_codon:yes gene_type:complete
MADSSYGNAMTEIALALAMAFFSIMVLTMVSMSATPEKISKDQNQPTINLANSAPNNTQKPTAPTKRKLVIFWNGQFMDQQLSPLELGSLKSSKKIVLAMPPNLPMADALAARAQLEGVDILVSVLDERWLGRMAKFDNKETTQ